MKFLKEHCKITLVILIIIIIDVIYIHKLTVEMNKKEQRIIELDKKLKGNY